MDIAAPLPFDSQLFGFAVSHLTCDKLSFSHIDSMLSKLENDGCRLVYWWSDINDKESQLAAEAMCGIHVGDKVKFMGNLSTIDEKHLQRTAAAISDIRLVAYDPSIVSIDQLLELSQDIAEHSRFNLDPQLKGSNCRAMFKSWINNSLNEGSMADHMIVALHSDDSVAGFVTVTGDGESGRVPLLVVGRQYRQRFIGTALFASALLWARQQCISHLSIAMSSDSLGVRIVEQFGFAASDRGVMWHFWLPRHGLDRVLPNNKPYFTGNELKYLTNVMNSQNISSAGRYTSMCHEWMEAHLRSPSASTYKALLVGSGTQALEMSAILAGIGHGDEVIMPSFTFVSTANAFVLRGGVPVFVDCRPDTLNIDETKIEAAITDKTKAIVVVHYAGIACEMDTIMGIAHRHNLVVIEDAAHAIMSYYKGRALGSIGDYGCFSFHYTKNLIAGECGALAINRPEHVRRAMIVWEKGTNRYDFLMGKVDKYAWVDVGSSFLPSEITAAVLWAQFEEGNAIQAARTWVWNTYHALLKDVDTIITPSLPIGTSPNGHIYWILLPDIATKQSVAAHLNRHDIQVFSHYVPLHSAPAASKYGISASLPVTESIANRLLRLPVCVLIPTLTQHRYGQR